MLDECNTNKITRLGLGILEFTCLLFQFGPALRQCIIGFLFTVSTFHWTTASRKPGLGLRLSLLTAGLAASRSVASALASTAHMASLTSLRAGCTNLT